MKQLEVDFFVIGAARAGTTSLFNYLRQHPKVFLPLVKECNYFSRVESMIREVYQTPREGEEYHMKIIRSEQVYRSLFAKAEKGQLKGEVSPSYMFDLETAGRIHKHNPHAKIIVTLRNPVERAYSHFQMHNATGYEPHDDFIEAIRAPKNPVWGGGNIYLEASRYFDQLKPYFDLFPREQLCVMVYEEWTRDPNRALADLFDFLDLGPVEEFHRTETHNRGVKGKHKGLLNFIRRLRINELVNRVLPREASQLIKEKLFVDDTGMEPLATELYQELMGSFEDDIRKTEELIGRPLSAVWESPVEDKNKKTAALD